MSWLLDGEGLELLYKAEVCSSPEYVCLNLLDKVQDRAASLMKDNSATPAPHVHTLQHRHGVRVAGLTVVLKVQKKHTGHLQELRQPHSSHHTSSRPDPE
ncbi:hypothetical protein E2C01_090536 [Portunus trituberculatus]|uniref:Uncharacterized protein n=1 Tax=Portunus trituberculatus TaxID=210409 RepID=A0A5B7JEY9_PORTR|nr:hypothetical protein [Portunus trituberculatus]